MLLAREDQVLAHGQFGEDLQQLEGAADAEPVQLGGPHIGDLAAIQLHAPFGRLELAEDAIEQGRLAAAIGTDDAEDLAFLHREGHPVDGLDATEGLVEIVDFQNRVHRPSPRLPVSFAQARSISPLTPCGQAISSSMTMAAKMIR